MSGPAPPFDEAPEGYTEEEWDAYRRGAAHAMQYAALTIQQAALNMAESVGEGPAPGEEADPEVCPGCGGEVAFYAGEATGACRRCGQEVEA